MEKYNNQDIKYYWKYEYSKDCNKEVWILNIEDNTNNTSLPETSFFSAIPSNASPSELGDIVVKRFKGATYHQVYYWKKGVLGLGGKYVPIFRD